ATPLLALILGLSLVACSREEPVVQEPDVVEEAVDTESAQPPAPDLSASDEPAEMVEESSAEAVVEDSKQPILLAQTEPAVSKTDWKYKEGQHYVRMVPTQPTVGGADKIEVAEFFWYGCAHCFDFEPHINRWAESKPAGVRFVRIPATWNPLVMLHAQLYYTEEVLAKNGKIADPEAFRSAVFREYHQRGNRMTTEAAIQSVFASQGVSADDFMSTWKSFEVAQKLRVAQDLARRYAISGVPAIVVNGKYRTGAGEAGGYPKLLELINELVERETIR
ncbi:MAG: thiol:disulfide interchange protein DsbA/DsbL, partial [Gammaproteobacteria bacterium]|nr:thiol:disulfide interchange protein DsbA/DsbL [Gammaproteobacteria bacterium]